MGNPKLKNTGQFGYHFLSSGVSETIISVGIGMLCVGLFEMWGCKRDGVFVFLRFGSAKVIEG